jgi:hypothetical protein
LQKRQKKFRSALFCGLAFEQKGEGAGQNQSRYFCPKSGVCFQFGVASRHKFNTFNWGWLVKQGIVGQSQPNKSLHWTAQAAFNWGGAACKIGWNSGYQCWQSWCIIKWVFVLRPHFQARLSPGSQWTQALYG